MRKTLAIAAIVIAAAVSASSAHAFPVASNTAPSHEIIEVRQLCGLGGIAVHGAVVYQTSVTSIGPMPTPLLTRDAGGVRRPGGRRACATGEFSLFNAAKGKSYD